MTVRVPRRLIAPLIACAIAGAAAIVGGACIPTTTSSNPPALRSGTYVLTSPNFHALPGVFVDASGRTLRVLADTLVIDIGQQTYEQHAVVAITPPGGTEAAPEKLVSARQGFSNGGQTFVLPSTIYGPLIGGEVLSNTLIQLRLPDQTTWQYDYR